MSIKIDVIDNLVGIVPGSSLDLIRRRRGQARDNAQASFDALFAPATPGEVSRIERLAVAAFVAGLTGEPATASFYLAETARLGAATGEAVGRELAQGRTKGPYGRYPDGPLSHETVAGPVYEPDAAAREALGTRLAAAFRHAHLLVLHPRDAAPADLQALLDAGWTTPSIVTLSQIIAFVSFQSRVVAGLIALNATAAEPRSEEAAHV